MVGREEIVVIVNNGLVEEIYGTSKDIDVRVIALDTLDIDEATTVETEAANVRKNMSKIW